jgi:hypothetical protein
MVAQLLPPINKILHAGIWVNAEFDDIRETKMH